MEMTLCFRNTERMLIHIAASLEDGCLCVEGCDSGEAVEEFRGDYDYEYRYCLDRVNTDKLFSLLCREGEPRAEALFRAFRGPDACRDLKQFCDANGIAYTYDSWV